MRSRIPKRYFLIPALYLVIIAFFVQLHLTGGGRITTEKIGPVQLWVEEAGGMNKGVESAKLTLYGFSVEFTGGIEFRAPDGATRLVGIEQVRTEEGSIEIALANGGTLRLANGYPVGAGMFRFPELYAPSQDYRGVAFFYEAPDTGSQELPVLPFALQRTGEIEVPEERLPIAVVRGEAESFMCAGARHPLLEGNTAWYALPANSGAPDVVVSPYGGENLRTSWVLGDVRPAEREEFAKAFASYLDTAYAGWKERYRTERIGWRRTEGIESAAEKIIAAFAAESLRRNGAVGLDRFEAAVEDGISQETMRAAVFLDSVVEMDTAARQSERSRAAEISEAVEGENPAVFAGTHDLASFLVWHGEQPLIRRVDNFAASLAERNGLSPAQAAGLFIFYADVAADYSALFSSTAELGEQIFSLLLPHFVRHGNTVFYGGAEGIELGTGLDLARSLIRYGEDGGSAFAASLGYTLAAGYLARSDEEGFLPRSLVPAEEGFTGEGELAPETVYPWISDNGFYPRVVSLAEEIDPGVRLLTAARAVGAVRNGNTVTITLDYEVGETQHVIVRGLGEFSNFFFYGLRWSSDRRFQDYAVGGWYYNGERDALYMKIRHQQKVERVMFDQ